MEAQSFLIVCIAAVLAILASIPRFPGAMIGFVFGIAVGFFLAPAAFALAYLLKRAGAKFNPKSMGTAMLILWCSWVAVLLVTAAMEWSAGFFDQARHTAAQAVVMGGVLAMGYFSSRAMARAWP